MISELRPAVEVWSDPSPPNDFCPYDHCSAKALFGTMRIEWKSWKDYPGYCLYFDAGETFIGSFDSLDRAKEHAAAVIEADREAVRAEQAAELAKFKALAETLAGALKAYAEYCDICHGRGSIIEEDSATGADLWRDCPGCGPATEALRQYKEARDAGRSA